MYINNKKANIFGNLLIGINDIPNLQNEINSISGGDNITSNIIIRCQRYYWYITTTDFKSSISSR